MTPANDPECRFEEVARAQLEGLRNDLQDLRQRFQGLEGKLAAGLVLICSNLATLLYEVAQKLLANGTHA